jgi:hypothetical protein
MVQISVGYVLAILVIVSLTSLTVLLVSAYKENLLGRYEYSTMKAITSSVAHTITSVYVDGQKSEFIPAINGKAILAKSFITLPEKISKKPYELKINNSEKLVCSYIEKKEVCSSIIGLPLDFNITGEIKLKSLNISYWRENNNTILDYIIID